MFVTPRSTPSCIEPRDVSLRRVVDVWPVDPRWSRVEWCDETGNPLGIITFERRATPRPRIRRRAAFNRLNLLLANVMVWLKETVACRLSTN